ncbi:pyridoxal phosphate-dependent transferase [Morchella snyderi]|nr:pyridoxal phosphate-dependent transferase [Morchella snyderi]
MLLVLGSSVLGLRTSVTYRNSSRVSSRAKRTQGEICPHDQDFITREMQDSGLFEKNIVRLDEELTAISKMLSQHSVPFWSPRYNGHMLMENSMAAVIGYLTTMLYNPNNVATEAIPFATMIEREVGRQLCSMLGLNTNPGDKSKTLAWGHITCDGSVANLESMWVARKLKFYPLSLRVATLEGQLKFLIDPGMQHRNPFEVTLCTGVKKLFKTCTTWELLNLTPDTVLDIPDQLYQQYGISQTFLQNALSQYLIRTLGKDYLEKKFGLVNPAKFYVGTTKHYSWLKAITGIGSENIIDVPVDIAARMDTTQLDSMLA